MVPMLMHDSGEWFHNVTTKLMTRGRASITAYMLPLHQVLLVPAKAEGLLFHCDYCTSSWPSTIEGLPLASRSKFQTPLDS